MISVVNIEVAGFETAVRGMRNAMQSHHLSDSDWESGNWCDARFVIGENDLNLMRRLYKAGPSHRKYLRQIYVGMDIKTNHAVWAQLDTYKIGTTRNSESKMHRIHVHGFCSDDFSHEGISEVGGTTERLFGLVVEELEQVGVLFNKTNAKKYWRAMIELLPMGYNLMATVTMNYENVINIIDQRAGHKMFEWDQLIEILKTLPYVREIMGEEEA